MKETINTTRIDDDSDKYKPIINSLETSFLMTALKYCTNEAHPLSASEIASAMSAFSHKDEYSDDIRGHSSKTILRKLRYIVELLEDDSIDYSSTRNAFILAYGGTVCCSTPKSERAKPSKTCKPQYKYYFKPLLSKDAITTLYGAIASNRYISDTDAAFIYQNLRLLSPATLIDPTKINGIDSAHDLPKITTDSPHYNMGCLNIFTIVNKLQDAISNKYQIEVEWGEYSLHHKRINEDISFESQNKTEPYVLNPYALFWYKGELYLLATPFGETVPFHLRVDHIISVEPFCSKSEPCAPIPEELIKFFISEKDKNQTFDSKMYTSTRPLLTISTKENLTTCVLECEESTLSLIVDTFGQAKVLDRKIRIKQSEARIAVQIPNVQYDDILNFCVRYHQYVTALSPDILVCEVFKSFTDTFLRYSPVMQATLKGEELSNNPFARKASSILNAINDVY